MKSLRFLLLFLFPCALFAADAPRLNILFVFADDWGRYASAYAKIDGKPTINDVIKTPNVDRVITGHSAVMTVAELKEFGEFNRGFVRDALAAKNAGRWNYLCRKI